MHDGSWTPAAMAFLVTGNAFFFFDNALSRYAWWDGPHVRSRIEVLCWRRNAKKRSKQCSGFIFTTHPPGRRRAGHGIVIGRRRCFEHWIGQV